MGAGPGPGGVWPLCDCVLALVWPISGRGAILCGGPGPASVVLGYLWGMVAGPGPGGEMVPSPKSGWTRSAKALDQVHCVSAEVLEWHRALDQVHGVSGTGIVIIVSIDQWARH